MKYLVVVMFQFEQNLILYSNKGFNKAQGKTSTAPTYTQQTRTRTSCLLSADWSHTAEDQLTRWDIS